MSDMRFSTNSEGFKPKMSNKKIGSIVLICAVALALLIVLFNCFSIVHEGYIGVKYRFGAITQDHLNAGLNFRIPFIEEIQEIDIRNQVYETTADAYTSDTQNVDQLQLKLNYYYDQAMLSQIIREVGVSNIQARLLVPSVAKIAKNEIGKVKAEELVQSRSEVQQRIQDELTNALKPYGIVVSAFAIENLRFDSAFEASIQAKVIAAQDALKMENKTKERQEEAKQVVIAAQAEADSVEISAAAEAKAIALIQEQLASSPNYVEYLKIMNWNGILPQVIGDGVNPFVVLDGGNQTSTAKTNTSSNTNTSANTNTNTNTAIE